MHSIVTRFRFGDSVQDIADELKLTVKEVLAVLRENSKQWDVVND